MQTVEAPIAPSLPYKALERAERGAKLLDTLQPGWRDAINLEVLDVASEDCCVLGQIHGSYNDAWLHSDLLFAGFDYDNTQSLEGFAVAHGFNCHHHNDDPFEHEREFDALDAAWERQISGR